MRKHGWQLPYHPLQVPTFSLFIFCFWGGYLCVQFSCLVSNLGILQNMFDFRYLSLQVVAVAVFLALGFAFYVFFAPFVGKKLFQYIVMGLYTPLVSHFEILLPSFVMFHTCIVCQGNEELRSIF